MRTITHSLLLFLAFVSVFIPGCNMNMAGGTSTSENGRVTGMLITDDGTTASRTRVVLLPTSFDPISDTMTLETDTTDTAGYYLFTDITPGKYTIQSVQIDSRKRAFTDSVLVIANDTTTVEPATLRQPGSIKIALPSVENGDSGYLYIPGTTISVELSGSDSFAILDSVPAGTVSSVIHTILDTVKQSLLQSPVEVQPEQTVTILETGWRNKRTIRFNTSSSGAAIDSTLYDFPVLIRLNDENFSFTEANSDGSDLLFTKADNEPVPHEIERWAPSENTAEIWVRIDTLAGGSTENILTMYWGNRRISSKQTSRPVFDTAAGFAAVWHLDEDGDSVYDVTAHGYHGVRFGSLSRSTGVIGYAQDFDTTEGYCEMGNIFNIADKSYTLTAWVRRDTSGLQTIFAKSYGDTASVAYGWSFSFGSTEIVHFFIADGGEYWGDDETFDFWSQEETTIIDTTSWHFVAVVVDRSVSSACQIFFDGLEITGTIRGDIAGISSLLNDLPFRIGAEADGDYQFYGLMDECIVSSTKRSPYWLRLCYINQGTADKLVEFD
jgi:hypothetical protein